MALQVGVRQELGTVEDRKIRSPESISYEAHAHCLLGGQELPDSMREDLYAGAPADPATRDKTVQAAEDEAAMKCRWLRLTIHKKWIG